MTGRTEVPPGPVLVAGLAGAAHLLVGYLYLVSGLAVPGYALLPLWAWWCIQAWWLARLARKGSWWTPVVPVTAVGSWALVVLLGDLLLGWTA